MLEDFLDGKVPEQDEVQIYTWMDATLGELADCVKKEVEAARKKEADLEFSFIYPDFNGKYRRKFVGSVF
jgi:histone deacetylase complex subunit SAP18